MAFKDFWGRELVVGDVVAFTRPHYRDLVKGKVIAFTPKKVRVEYNNSYGRTDTYLSEPDFLIKSVV